jgi:hypothetical protein
MAKLTTKDRKKVSGKEFGEPGKRAYPMPDKAHAANAKARAIQMVKKSKLSESEKKKIDAKANKKLAAKVK